MINIILSYLYKYSTKEYYDLDICHIYGSDVFYIWKYYKYINCRFISRHAYPYNIVSWKNDICSKLPKNYLYYNIS